MELQSKFQRLLVETDTTVLTLTWKCGGPRIAKITFGKKQKQKKKHGRLHKLIAKITKLQESRKCNIT